MIAAIVDVRNSDIDVNISAISNIIVYAGYYKLGNNLIEVEGALCLAVCNVLCEIAV